ncbi:fatty acid synthase-like [Coccinella septempunctata]|uniref:fatty acid synthase-like n=1 Tax=Coccinella septempunctata TaxID=41139 RepID=UPI001D089ACB|nr:fatty acid synthase-like [Coccinella septempunctata]
MARASSEKMNGSPEPPQVQIAITGLSGRFPESDNIEEFKQQLLDGIDMITSDPRRWPSGLHGLPERFGKLKNLTHFDAQHFGVHAKQAEQMDPQVRLLLEVTHEAILDAGYNPNELRGTKCGVFMGICASESLEYWERDADEINGYGLTGCSRSMFANRISYAFDFKGPSFTVDTACSSSLYAFSQAIKAIQSGECDSAIVGGANLLLKPNACLHFLRLGMVSPEGACKSFDSSANGYVRAESVAAILLQKSGVARRVYASVLGAKTNSDGYKDLGITYPSGEIQLRLIQEIYAETGVDPTQIDYLEAHGTGTKVGDPQELNAVAEFFCKNRNDPLMIGSVKSNMGHSEGASGVCSIAKVVIAMETGIIPKNLHFKNPNPEIPSLSDGRLKVVTENIPWRGGTVGINSFGFGGANAHVILRSNVKPKITPKSINIPRLIGVSGRTEEAVKELLDVSIKNKDDSEFLSLLDQIHSSHIPGHKFRGYALLEGSFPSEIHPVASDRRPIWYVYPGMGTQWPAMGRDFMKVGPFRRSIQKTAAVLKPHGIDLEDLIVNGNEETFENVVNAYVAITAIQIALTDMLRLLGIEPEGVIGHSFGEVGCAYADGCLTAEQAILCTLERGLAITRSNCPPGSMASVGLTWKEAKERCPPLVYPACHNSENNVTISGDRKELSKFIMTLASEDVFAREVKSAGFAFHCRHISKAAPLLQKSLENVIPNPKTRSARWVSTSVPESSWNKPSANLCSPEYFVNNLLSPVLFREATNHIPKNALIVEIAPTALFQSLLKRSVGGECSTVSLSKRGQSDNVSFFMSAIGKMYAAGAQPCLSGLYGKPSFPVGRGTGMISPHVKWDHSTEWAVASFVDETQQSGECLVEVDMTKEENKYLLDHKIDGRVLYPGAGYLILIWKTFAKLKNQDFEKMPVVLEDIHLHRATILSKEETVKFFINILMGTGAFELREGGSLVVSGKIRVPEDINKETVEMSKFESPAKDDHLPLSKEDIYKDLLLRGYEYSDSFKGIVKSDNIGHQGDILWNNNWICFVDFVLQFTVISKNTQDLVIPTKLQKLIIDPIVQKEALWKNSGVLPVEFNRDLGIIKCGGVEGRGLKASLAPKRLNHRHPKLEKYKFIPYHLTENHGRATNLSKTELLTILSQIVLENSSSGTKLKMNEVILKGPVESSLSPLLKKILESEPSVSVDSTVVTFQPVDTTLLNECGIKHSQALNENVDFSVCHDLLTSNDIETFKTIVNAIRKKGFILLEESKTTPAHLDFTTIGLQMISSIKTSKNNYFLLRKQPHEHSNSVMIKISNADFSWVEPLKKAVMESDAKGNKVYLYSEEKLNGVMGMVNALRKETGGSNLRCIFIQDQTSKPFSIDNCSDQLKGDLVHNIFKEGVWGCYRHLMLENIEESNRKLVPHAIINTLTRGDLSSLRWIESPLSNNHKGIELCNVYYASLNFRDIMLATGRLPPDALPGKLAGKDNILGLEFAGRDSNGDRLMGLVESRSLATTVMLDNQFYWKVPEKWSLEEAATIPVAYCTAYYSLIQRGNLQPGESVLIHAGSGGVGIASISLALHMGCQVFTTVGSRPKREFLKKTFPELSDKNIGYSRDTSFEQFILSETRGRGVDVVLNSLAADQLYASVRCLANNGRFLEIGKVDLSNDSPLGMNVFLKNISFHGILVDALHDPAMAKVQTELVKLVSEGIDNGAVRPLPATVFSEGQVEEAFRYMATGQHIGKVVIKIRDEEPQTRVKPIPKLVSAIPRAYMNPEKIYILVGGLGGLGLELTNWLVNRGATKVLLSSRFGIKTGYQSLCVRKWREKGVTVIISTEDVTTETGVRRLIQHAKTHGPVGGIFNLAAVLRDKTLKNQTEETFSICCLPKVTVTMHLDKVSRETTKDLDYFVIFSSVTCGRGNIGQSNYAFANSVMERICEDRREAGLPGLAIQWGAVGDVGLAMELLGTNDMELAGTLPQRISSCLNTLDVFLEQSNPIVSSLVLADNQASVNAKNKVDLIDTIANILGLKDKNNWPKNSTLSELGMDSLMTAEIKHTLERNFDIILNSAEIRALTLDKLTTYESNLRSTDDSTLKSSNKENQQLVVRNIEVMPKRTLVKMSKEDVSCSKSPLFIIHPIEGKVDALAGMARRIKAPVYGLQCTADAPLEDIETLAKFYLEHVKTVQPHGPYTIVGYSFGACVAFEMGLQLEKEGQEVKLWFIDGSPSYVSVHLVRERANKSIEANTDEEQSEALVFFMTQFRDVDEEKIVAELMELPSWQERLSSSMKTLSAMTSLPASELALAASSFFHKIQAADKYKPSTKIRGEVCLLKATDNDLKLDRDYGLSEICQQMVKIYTLEGNHTSILTGSTAEKLANILQPK